MKNILKIAMITVISVASAFAVEIDASKSTIQWQGTKVKGRHWGTINIKKGNVELQEGQLKSGEVIVDINTLNSTDISGEWKKKLDDHLKNADFFEVSKYPEAKLKINDVKGQTAFGSLTIKGKTNNVEFPVAKIGKRFVGSLKFDRTKYGLKYGSTNFFKGLGDKAIANEIDLVFDIVTK